VEARLTGDELLHAQTLTRQVPVGEAVVDAILRLVRNGRPESSELEIVRDRVSWGPGPRASQALMLACRARAMIQGRLAPSTEDVVALAKPVLRHRMALNFAARAEGHDMDSTIDALIESSV
jgi:MoxR-like ATPase